MFKQYVTTAALAALAFSMLAGTGAVAAEKAELNADEVLERLDQALKVAGQADSKRALLADAAKISSLRALELAAAAAADKEVAKEALAAAGQIARTLMAAGQPAYVRRSAFLRWVACQPGPHAANTVIEALRGTDAAVQSAAVSVLRERDDGALLESVAAEISSFAPAAQTSLLDMLAGRGDAAVAALVELAGHKDKKVATKAVAALGTLGGPKALAAVGKALTDADASVREAALQSLAGWADASALPVLLGIARKPASDRDKTLALRGIARLALIGNPDKAAQATLLEALNLVTDSASDEAALAGAQIAQALAPSHPRESRQALDALAKHKLSDDTRQSVRAALLHAAIGQLPNLAIGAKATSPDGIDSDGPRPDAHAIDGNPATYWDEMDDHPLYRLRVEFPKGTDVSAISIIGWAHHSFSPKDFEIVCDDKTVKTVTGATYVNNRVIVAFQRTRCTSLELKITGCYGGSPAVRELGIFDAP